MKEKFIISLVSQVSSRLIYYFAYYLLFYNLDVQLMGIWALIDGIINLGFLFINIGLDIIHFQYSGKKNSREYFGTYFFLKIIILLVNIFITIIIITVVSNIIFWESKFTIYSIFFFFLKIIVNISNIFIINLKTKIKIFKAETPYFIITSGKSIAILLLSINLTLFLDPLLYLCTLNLFFDILYMISVLILSKNEFTMNKISIIKAQEYLKDIKPLFIMSIIIVISNNLGNLILDYFYGHKILGYFSLVNNYILPILLLISSSIITTYFPLFAKYFEQKNISEIKNMTYIMEKYSSIIYLGMILIVYLNGELIFSLFLPHYIESLPILHIMIFIPYLISITRPYAYQFVAGKKQHVNAYINILTHSSIIILMILFIPQNLLFPNSFITGSIGYALAQTLPWILWVFLNRFYIAKMFKIKARKRTILHLPSCFLSLFLSYWIKSCFIESLFFNSGLLLILSSFFSISLFLFSLCLLKEIKREDIRFFIQLAKFKTYKTSFKEEFAHEI